MTSPTIMNREQLIELAALDAYGLLDEFESDLYTRSFHHAPAAVQDEVVRFQAELAADSSLLPSEDPPAELRQRVLQAVSRAIERQHSELAPLATIGRRRETSDNFVDSRYVLRPAALWRAAAFILAGTVAVMAYFWSQSSEYARTVSIRALENRTHEQLKELIGPDFEDFFGSPVFARKTLVPADGAQPGVAKVWIDEQGNKAFVLAMDLPSNGNQSYVIRVRETSGTVHRLAEFVSNGTDCGLRLDGLAKAALATTAIWEIVDASGAVVLRSA